MRCRCFGKVDVEGRDRSLLHEAMQEVVGVGAQQPRVWDAPFFEAPGGVFDHLGRSLQAQEIAFRKPLGHLNQEPAFAEADFDFDRVAVAEDLPPFQRRR